uniref:Uncharacterized protein n=1 Tax=Arundo donax TaxID=35708 RepID=A0A0A9BEY0_ARUDO
MGKKQSNRHEHTLRDPMALSFVRISHPAALSFQRIRQFPHFAPLLLLLYTRHDFPRLHLRVKGTAITTSLPTEAHTPAVRTGGSRGTEAHTPVAGGGRSTGT